ncbi:MAG TPA: hypothetical protein VGA39_07235 [Candidatus Acidoferrales bacterium]
MRRVSSGRRERGGALKVILLILAGLIVLAMVAVVFAFWMVRDYVQVDTGQGFEIQTPVGGMKIEKAEDVARELRLPLYPGVTPLDVGVRLRMQIDKDDKPEGFDLTAAKFATNDSFERVDDWYRAQLGSEFVREQGRLVTHDPGESGDKWRVPKLEGGGTDVLYKYERGDYLRAVALERHAGRVEISLLELRPVQAQ